MRAVVSGAVAAFALICSVGVSAAAAQTTCTPTINPAGTPTPGTVVAPGLRVISTQWGLGNCPGFFVAARAADGTIWATDYSNDLWKSTNDLRTLTETYTATAYEQIEQVLPLSSGTILILVRDSSGNRHVLRSTDSSGTSFATTPVLNLPSGAQLHDSNSWIQVGGAVYIGQYRGGPPENLYKSTDDGQTWSVVFSATQSDEIHAIYADPYVPGRIWMMLDGDEDELPGTQVGYSDDGGNSWTWVTNGSYPESRVVGLMFDSNAVYWGTDSADVPAGLFRYDRSTGHVTETMTKLNGPFTDAVGYDGQSAQFSDVETTSEGYVGDQNIHVITNGDGTSWSETTTPWSRDQTNPNSDATPEGNTQPDSEGRFWVSWFDLAGSPDLDANIEYQFDPTAKYSGLSSSFTASPNPFTSGHPVSFDGSASSTTDGPLSYLWNFGDGTSASGAATESHTYSSGGPFTASLQVGDANNDQALSTMTVASTPQPPTAATGAAPATATGATLYGEATPNGSATTAHFEYGTSTAYGSQTSAQSAGSGTAPQSLSASISNLQPNTTYHYRLDATNTTGTSQGIDRTFTTPPAPTSATTAAATNVGGSTATVNGSVDPSGLETTVYFNYGTSTAYGSTSASQDAGSGTSTEQVKAALSGLSGNTTYHYEIVAVNESGTYYGSDQSFTTGGPAPAATTNAATFVGSTGATVNATVNPNGSALSVYFEYGTTSSYGSQSASQNAGSGTSAEAVSATLSSLQSYTTYHYRVDAVGANGTTYGSDATFTTTAGPPLVTTFPATGVTASGGTLNGTVNSQGLTSTAYFQYGTSTSYGSQTSSQTLPGNLVPNPGCANGTTTGWSIYGTPAATFQAQTGWASVGPSSCRFTTGTLPSGGYSEADVVPYISGITPGAQYNVAVDLNVLGVSSGQRIYLYVTWYDVNGNNVGSKTPIGYVNSTGVATLSGAVTAPAGAVQGQVDVTVENAGTADLYFDNAQLVAAGSGSLQSVSAQLSNLAVNTVYHYRTVATSSAGTTYGTDQTFTTSPSGPPAATTNAATFVGSTGATVNATVNPNGSALSVYFEYGTTSSYGSQSASQNAGSGTSAEAVSATLSSLQPYTTYHYRVDAVGANGTTYGSDATFTTTAGPPLVTTFPATGVTASGGTLNGTVNSQGLTSTAYFQYGTSTSYGSQTSSQTLPGNLVPNPGCANGTTTGWSIYGTPAATFQAQTGWASVGPSSCRFTTGTLPSGGYSEADVVPYISGITPGAQYNVAVDLNVLGVSSGQRIYLYVTWYDVNGNNVGSKTPIGYVNSTGVATLSGAVTAPAGAVQGQVDVTVENAGTADLYFDNAQLVAAGSGSLQSVSAQLSNLAVNTVYHYRTVATSSAGTTYGTDQTFTTAAPTSLASSPTYSDTTTWSVGYTASDATGGSGLAEVDLYAEAPGQSSYTKVASDTSGSGSGSFTYSATAGQGTYSFYTIATDNVGSVQPTPSAAQTTTLLDTTSPTSSASSPATSSTTSWNVTFTASDNQGGSGLAEVDLYAEAPGQSSYTKVASDTSGSGSGSFHYTAAAGQGTYNFYALATDNAGNVQAAPSSAQTSTVLSTTAPTSSASSPAYSNTSSWNVTFTASDTGGPGLAEVDLYAEAPGQSSYTKVASNTSPGASGNFTYNATAGQGSYSFYTIATDSAGSVQPTPGSAQTSTLLDTTAPTSTASSPATSSTTTWNVTFTASDSTGGSGLAEVDLYAKAPGQTSYTKVASNTSPGASGSFSYTGTAGNGTYSFYTLATDKAGNTQAAPGSPQTTTVLNNGTTTTVAAPTSGVTGTTIAASSISSKLSGATSGATGTITFKVFGPQASAPTTCTTGGTTVGTASVNGSGTYSPSGSGYKPATAGTYWWYASYGGDGANVASNSGCGSGMASTAVLNTTAATAAAPATGVTGTAIAASSISSVISGATTGAGGTITFKVFGPQATAPTTCTSGGTQIGSPVTVSGNKTYHPSAGVTPATAGDYWVYASYSGDASNSPANSTCGSTMAETVVYSLTSAASVTSTTSQTSTTTSSFAVAPSTTYLLLVARQSTTGDSITSIASTGITPALSTSSFTSITSQKYNTSGYQYAYYVTTAATASGTGTLTVGFSKASGSGGSTIIELVRLGGNSSSAPIVTANKVTDNGFGRSATANLPSAPGTLDAEVVFLGVAGNQASAPTATPTMTSIFYSHQSAGTADVFSAVPAQQKETLSLGTFEQWGTTAFEIQHG